MVRWDDRYLPVNSVDGSNVRFVPILLVVQVIPSRRLGGLLLIVLRAFHRIILSSFHLHCAQYIQVQIVPARASR